MRSTREWYNYIDRLVQMIPKELLMMSLRIHPYLNFDGNAKEAVYFYEKALGGEVTGIMTFGDMPEDPDHPMTEEVKNRVMHAQLKIGESLLMFSDTIPGMPIQHGDTVQIAILPDEEERARAIFTALEDGGEVILPLQKTDWSPSYGIVKDKFGIRFQISVSMKQ